MKTCPTCHQTYDAASPQRFCGNDGTALVSINAPPLSGNPSFAESAANFAPNAASGVNPAQQFSAPPPTPVADPSQASGKGSWLGNLVSGVTATPPQVSIQTDRPNGIYFPGETVRVQASVYAPDAVSVNQIYAGFLYEEECEEIEIVERRVRVRDSNGYYRTTLERRDVKHWRKYAEWLGQETIVHESKLPAGFQRTFQMQWQIPDAPEMTYRGTIVRAGYKFRVAVDRPQAKDANGETVLPITMIYDLTEDARREYQKCSEATSKAQISFWLPKLNYVQGETVAGRVLIEPRGSIKVRSVNLVFKRDEYTLGGHRRNHHTFDDQTIQLAGAMSFQAGIPATFDFQMPLPARWQPTISTAHSQTFASLDLRLDVPWGKDFAAAQPIYIYYPSQV